MSALEIVLSVLRCPDGLVPGEQRSSGSDIVIGRDTSCTWVLPDPARHLSKRHCAIEFRSGGWQVRDLSTNGTYLNAAAEPIGRELTMPLSNGDRLRLGQFEIEVQLKPAQAGYSTFNPSNLDDILNDIFGKLPHTSEPRDIDTDFPLPDTVPSIHTAHTPRPVTATPLPPELDWESDLDTGGELVVTPAPPPAERQHAAPPPQAAEQDALLAAFLTAAGLPPGSLARQEDPVATMRALGAAFGAAMKGMRALLIARGKVKQEFRIEQTMLRPGGNNPLKFAASETAAIQQLIKGGEAGASAAVRDVVADLESHEVATMVAAQAAAKALLDRLSPAAVEASSEAPQGGLVLLPAQRKARLWEDYARHHARLVREFDDDFDSIFNKAFARAYERAAAAGRRNS